MPNRRATRRALGLLLLALATFACAGCRQDESVSPTRIAKIAGDSQCGLPGEQLPRPLVIQVLGPRGQDFLGRRGSRPPAVGANVQFRVERLSEYLDENQDPSTEIRPYPILLSEEGGTPGDNPRRASVNADQSGFARVWVQLGSANDDWRIEAFLEDANGKEIDKEHFRIVSGVRKTLEANESSVGDKIDLAVQLAKFSGDPAKPDPLPGRVVFFRVVGEPAGTSEPTVVSNRRDITDDKGVRSGSTVTLGDRPGTYTVLAEIEPFEDVDSETATVTKDKPIRGVLFQIVALDWYRIATSIAVGTLLFLIGVRFLAGGFLLIFGPHLHFESGPWTENRMLGYLGGAMIGAASQSWSSVSTHIVSFVNGGMLSARAGITLLLGASLGATILPQFLSLELSFLNVPFLAAGILCLFLPRGRGLHSLGWIFLGGGLVLSGWSLLAEGTDLLKLSESIRSNLAPLSIDFSGDFSVYATRTLVVFFAGLGVGFLLRSSNLVVILSIMLASHSILSAETCVPLIVGANVGSAILLFARSVLKRREAKRIAAAGLLFHLLTSVIILALSLITVDGNSIYLWLVEAVTPGRLLNPTPESIGHHLAMSHTLYNLIGGILFLLAPGTLHRLVDKFIRPGSANAQVKPHSLDANLIAVPSLALRQVRQEVIYMTELAQKTVADAFDAFRYGDYKLGDQVVRREETLSGLHRDVTRYLVLVGENPLTRGDASLIKTLQSTSSALARIAASAELVLELTTRRVEEKVESSDDVDREVSEVYDLILAQFDNIITLLGERDPKVEESVVKTVERLTKSRTRLETQWRQRIEQSESEWGTGVRLHIQSSIYQEAFNLLFRVGSDLAHVAQQMRLLAPDRL